jgi:hypothetical protein
MGIDKYQPFVFLTPLFCVQIESRPEASCSKEKAASSAALRLSDFGLGEDLKAHSRAGAQLDGTSPGGATTTTVARAVHVPIIENGFRGGQTGRLAPLARSGGWLQARFARQARGAGALDAAAKPVFIVLESLSLDMP